MKWIVILVLFPTFQVMSSYQTGPNIFRKTYYYVRAYMMFLKASKSVLWYEKQSKWYFTQSILKSAEGTVKPHGVLFGYWNRPVDR